MEAKAHPQTTLASGAHRVVPKVFLVGETKLIEGGLQAYLDHVGADGWLSGLSERPSDPELLVEAMGRLCYRSWAPGMNPNVTKVREGNDVYLGNILSSGHGSVIEHSMTNWIFADVSRVLTHELVRHRAGTAFSQESLRYVRLEDLGFWMPPEVEGDPRLKDLFERTFSDMGELQKEMARILDLDGKKDFQKKKALTSAMRRLAPDGLATTIGVSFNFRALRHVIEMRTSKGAEEEIRVVFDQVAALSKERWPNIFQDFTRSPEGEWEPAHHKI